jgi:polar amino acid transport system substrate-binding protein
MRGESSFAAVFCYDERALLMCEKARFATVRRWVDTLAAASFLLTLLFVAPARAERAGPSVLTPGTLIWGGDQEGGGPYVYPADDDPLKVIGFEVELADQLAQRLGLRAQFFQGQWDKMLDLLRARKCDIVLNGYEWLPSRLDAMEATIPYYVFGLQLLAREKGELTSWADLERPFAQRKRRIGVLIGSAAESYLLSRPSLLVEIVSYDGSTDAMREVETGKLDATLQDTPAATFYRSRFPALRAVGAPVGHGYYVIYARKGEKELVRRLNQALLGMIDGGEIEKLYRAYDIWNDAQRELAEIAQRSQFFGYAAETNGARPNAGPREKRDARDGETQARSDRDAGPSDRHVEVSARKRGFEVVRSYAGVLLQSAGLTVMLSCLSFPLAVMAGLLIAVGRLYGPRWLRTPLTAYVEFLRGTPVMLQLYFIFFFLPEIGINVPAFWTAILGLSVNYSAYESEIYRAGLSAVPKGQMEAALALGMSRPLALRRIIVPQAVRIVVPPVVNDFIALFKDTSVCSVVTLVELTKRFSVLSQSTQATTELMAMTALLYLAMSYPLSLVSKRLELGMGRALA